MDRWAQRLHLERYLDVRLAEVSKGTAQKVGLIQALVARPDLLVLDEPWEGLDVSTRDEVPQIIAEVLALGGSVLVSDHLGEVERLPDVRDGHVRVELPPAVPSPGPPPVPPLAPPVVPTPRPEPPRDWLIEVAAAEPDVPATVDRLRAEGHDVVGVRARDQLIEPDVGGRGYGEAR